jgi:hypothetical protein
MRRTCLNLFVLILGLLLTSPVPAMDYLYERLAYKHVPELSGMEIGEKEALVGQTLDLLVERISASRFVNLVMGTRGEDRTEFPQVDMNLDNEPDEAVGQVEVSFPADVGLLYITDIAHSIALQWSIVAYTDSLAETVEVVIEVPETILRIYFRDESVRFNLDGLLGTLWHQRLRFLVTRALWNEGYATWVNEGVPGTEMPESRIMEIAAVMGPLTLDFIAPSLTLYDLPATITPEDVVAALEAAVAVARVPDLTGDGVVTELDQYVLPAAFVSYLMQTPFEGPPFDGMTIDDDMLGQLLVTGSTPLWDSGATFQQWNIPRTTQMDYGPLLGRVYIVKLCQHFYSATPLMTGLHHAAVMPCAVMVWQELGVIRLSLLNPQFLFVYLFPDAGPNPEWPTDMQQRFGTLFGLFPTFVFNEQVVMVNAALESLGSEERMDYLEFPGM